VVADQALAFIAAIGARVTLSSAYHR